MMASSNECRESIRRIFHPRGPCMRIVTTRLVLYVCLLLPITTLHAVDNKFHNAPDSAKTMKNPVEGQAAAVEAGKKLYGRNCLSCHGRNGKGSGNVPPLAGKLDSVPSGEVFWFI